MATRGIEAGESTRALARQYSEVRATSVRLAAPLSAEDQMLQSMPEASPTKWHLAHTTWFFETFLLTPHARDYRPFDPRFRQLFNSYYKQVGGHPYRGARGLMSRPSLDEVHAYRRGVDEAMLALIERADDPVLALVELGLNHEQQHQELILTDIKHALWSSPLRPAYRAQPSTSSGRRRAGHEVVHVAGVQRRHSRDRASPAKGLPSTTKGRGTRFCCGRSASRRARSPAASGWNSWPMADIAVPSCGSPTAGTRLRAALGGAAVLGAP